jgi:predicted AlkP superfamily pyrophosphatase or phosphodiesterase
MKQFTFILSFCFAISSCNAQNIISNNKSANTSANATNNSKLVVGIVVDQMRYDYLTRFESKYGNGGFKRMMTEGFNCKNNHFNYIPTKTGPGHASINTGTTPSVNGIIGNDWFEKNTMQKLNCVEDNSVEPLGTLSNDGKKSPIQMITSTFADENRLFTQMRGKTIGVSIKHRGAILPAGHSANAAYWWDYDHDGNGNWISSSYYMDQLPKWVNDFNNSGQASSYFKTWNTLYDIESYSESGKDNNDYERIYKGENSTSFPHDLNKLKNDNGGYKIIAESPFGNSLTTDFAIKAIEAESLGQDNITDVITISYSSTDKVGHDYAPNSIEIEDTYLRLDLDLERLFKYLDSSVGVGEYTVFLTSDHGVPHAPMYSKSKKIPSGFFNLNAMLKDINEMLKVEYNQDDLALSRINNQIFLDHQKIEKEGLQLQVIKKQVAKKILSYDLISNVYITTEYNRLIINNDGYQEALLFNGHNQKRSGDVVFTFNPEVFKDTQWNRTGSDHHSGYNYDSHVPLLFFGKGIKQGHTLKRTRIIDIAPTISALLGISFPNGATGMPLEFILD